MIIITITNHPTIQPTIIIIMIMIIMNIITIMIMIITKTILTNLFSDNPGISLSSHVFSLGIGKYHFGIFFPDHMMITMTFMITLMMTISSVIIIIINTD